jgi:hypothetical protein
MKKAFVVLALLLLVGTMVVGTLALTGTCEGPPEGCGWCTTEYAGQECWDCCIMNCPNSKSAGNCICHCSGEPGG